MANVKYLSAAPVVGAKDGRRHGATPSTWTQGRRLFMVLSVSSDPGIDTALRIWPARGPLDGGARR